MRKFTFCISAQEYDNFRAHKATRLYLHSYNAKSGEITVETSKPTRLCRDLEQVIDFGATSACEVLNIHMLPVKSVGDICKGY